MSPSVNVGKVRNSGRLIEAGDPGSGVAFITFLIIAGAGDARAFSAVKLFLAFALCA